MNARQETVLLATLKRIADELSYLRKLCENELKEQDAARQVMARQDGKVEFRFDGKTQGDPFLVTTYRTSTGGIVGKSL